MASDQAVKDEVESKEFPGIFTHNNFFRGLNRLSEGAFLQKFCQKVPPGYFYGKNEHTCRKYEKTKAFVGRWSFDRYV